MSSKDMTRDQFYEFLRKKNYRVNRILADGNCLYRALAAEVLDNQDFYSEIREDLFHFVTSNQNRDDYVLYFTGRTPDQIKREIDDIRQDEEWGSNLSLMAASEYYKYNIQIETEAGTPIKYPENGIYARTIYLSYHVNHYDHLEKIEASASSDNRLNTQYVNKVDNDNTSKTNMKTDNADNRSKVSINKQDTAKFKTKTTKKALDNKAKNKGRNKRVGARKVNNSNDKDLEESSGMSDIEDEEEDNFTNECSKFNTKDPSSSTPEDLNLHSSYMYKFLAAKIFATSRAYVDVLILVPHHRFQKTLLETFLSSKGKEIYLLVDYNNKGIRKDLQMDRDMGNVFHIFQNTIKIPHEKSMHTRSVWLSHLIVKMHYHIMVVPLLLSALRYTWNEVRIETLCRWNLGSLPLYLLDKAWSEMREKLKSELELILSNPEALFCERCSKSCMWKPYSWHIDLQGFRKVNFLNGPNSGFWEKHNIFQAIKRLKPPVIRAIRRVFYSNNPNRFDELLINLDRNSRFHKTTQYSSYLVLIMDGENMDNYKDYTPFQLLKQKDVYKLIYAGCCKNEEFRTSHFRKKSSIFDVLTRTSKNYFVRQKWYKSRDAVRTDEAVVIEILKGIVNYHNEKKTDPGFYLLNKSSSSSYLLRLGVPYIKFMTQFCASGIPLLNTDPNNTEVFHDGLISGNYVIEKPVNMERGAYTDKGFTDVFEVYKDITNSR